MNKNLLFQLETAPNIPSAQLIGFLSIFAPNIHRKNTARDISPLDNIRGVIHQGSTKLRRRKNRRLENTTKIMVKT